MRALRHVLPLLVAMLLISACGDGDADEDAPGAALSGEGSIDRLSLQVAGIEPLRTGAPASWTLEIHNGSDGPVTLLFSDGRSGDISLTGADGEVYRWSADKVFTQALREETLPAGETRKYVLEEPSLEVPPGTYSLTAELASNPTPEPVSERVEVEA